ncbi:MAG: DinB family protein [Acidobacteria bacterium]|nr:DinB family protein [Acidobacteriota bacterium]
MGDHTGQLLLAAAIDEAFEKKSWHGPNLRGALRGVTAAEALWRPAAGRHNIWELAVHCAYWKYVVRRRLSGARRGSFPLKGSNFIPAPEGAGEQGWRAAVELLCEQHRQMRALVAELPAARFAEQKTVHLIRGAAAHDLYHAGQIQLLKRLQTGAV